MGKPIELIVARDSNWGIGLNGKIPWRCRDDLLHFRDVTTLTKDPTKKNAVIMGRVTWDSLNNKPLAGRENICISRSPQTIATCSGLDKAIEYANDHPDIEKIFIIGGCKVYREALEELLIQKIYMTVIKQEFPCDRFVRFIRSHLNNYMNKSLTYETPDYAFWEYSSRC